MFVFSTKVQTWGQQQSQKIEANLAALEAEKEEIQRILDWISSAEEALCLRDQEPLAETTEQNQELIEQHAVRPSFLFLYRSPIYTPVLALKHLSCLQIFMEELNKKFPDVEAATKSCRHKSVPKQVSPSKRPLTSMKTYKKNKDMKSLSSTLHHHVVVVPFRKTEHP